MQQQQLGFGYNLYDFDFGGDGHMQSNFGMRLQLPVERANHLRFGLCKYKQQYQSLRQLQSQLQQRSPACDLNLVYIGHM